MGVAKRMRAQATDQQEDLVKLQLILITGVYSKETV